MRPTVVTELLKAGYDSRQVMTFTGHKTTAMVQHYSRQLEGMQKEGKKKASALLTPSGTSYAVLIKMLRRYFAHFTPGKWR